MINGYDWGLFVTAPSLPWLIYWVDRYSNALHFRVLLQFPSRWRTFSLWKTRQDLGVAFALVFSQPRDSFSLTKTTISFICSNSSGCRKAVNSSRVAVWSPLRSAALNLLSSRGSIFLKVWWSEESWNSAGFPAGCAHKRFNWAAREGISCQITGNFMPKEGHMGLKILTSRVLWHHLFQNASRICPSYHPIIQPYWVY